MTEDAGVSKKLKPVTPKTESARHAVVGVRMKEFPHGLSRLHCAAAQVFRPAFWLPRGAHRWHLVLLAGFIVYLPDVEFASLVVAVEFIIKEGLWLWRFIMVSDKPGERGVWVLHLLRGPGPEEFMGELVAGGPARRRAHLSVAL